MLLLDQTLQPNDSRPAYLIEKCMMRGLNWQPDGLLSPQERLQAQPQEHMTSLFSNCLKEAIDSLTQDAHIKIEKANNDIDKKSSWFWRVFRTPQYVSALQTHERHFWWLKDLQDCEGFLQTEAKYKQLLRADFLQRDLPTGFVKQLLRGDKQPLFKNAYQACSTIQNPHRFKELEDCIWMNALHEHRSKLSE